MTSITPETLIVADASRVISLAKIGYLEIIYQLANEVWIPREVGREAVDRGGNRPKARSIAARFESAARDADPLLVGRFNQHIDAGEAEALALACAHPGCLLPIDDAAGREVAGAHGIRCIGTAGLLLRTKRTGLIPSMADDLASLRRHGLFVHDELVRQWLNAAGEMSAS